MKIIISGGGTGGHIYPALAIADALKREYKGAQILYIGTASGLESSLVPKHGLQFKAIRVKGFKRKFSMDTLGSSIELVKGLYDAEKLLRGFRPDIVIGTGGYVAGPVLMVAHLKGVPTLIHEQNVLPGVTNRILGRFADAIAVSFEEAVKYFVKKERIIITGNPVRQEVIEASKEVIGKGNKETVKELGFVSRLPIVLSFGGSKGSIGLNRAMVDFISGMTRSDTIKSGGFQLLHVAGGDHYDGFMQSLKEKGIFIKDKRNIKVMPYLHYMPRVLSISDLVITSAGAITIAEITAMGLPAILIPKPYVADNHQEYNARALEKKGAAIVFLENRLDGGILLEKVLNLLGDKKSLLAMKKAGKSMAKTDAAQKICDIIAMIANK